MVSGQTVDAVLIPAFFILQMSGTASLFGQNSRQVVENLVDICFIEGCSP